jgi:hypothetical protein
MFSFQNTSKSLNNIIITLYPVLGTSSLWRHGQEKVQAKGYYVCYGDLMRLWKNHPKCSPFQNNTWLTEEKSCPKKCANSLIFIKTFQRIQSPNLVTLVMVLMSSYVSLLHLIMFVNKLGFDVPCRTSLTLSLIHTCLPDNFEWTPNRLLSMIKKIDKICPEEGLDAQNNYNDQQAYNHGHSM